MNYRRDIDGLRALAVLPVVLYHAGIPGIPGGFVGVDIFFVISGYLITSLIVEDLRNDRFTILGFYERRVRRIFPALIVVLSVTAILASKLLFPIELEAFGVSLVATILFGSNLLFWHRTGYFAAPAAEEPLLHTWSLAVEEQFYVIFPLLLLYIYRRHSGRWMLWLVPISVVSFATSVWGVTHTPSSAFYLAPTRAWELLFGSLLALNALPRSSNRWLMELLSGAGLCLIAWGVLALSATAPFPGFNAIFPCLGAGLIIYAGESVSTKTSKLLGAAPLVFVGLISYSLYLWHWPLLVFASIWNVHPLTALETAYVVGLSFLAAILSWRFVEAPFRKRDGFFQRKRLFITAATFMALLAIFGVFGVTSHGWPDRIPARMTQIASYSTSKNPRRDLCFNTPNYHIPVERACIYGADVPPSYAVWGDSHADALISGIGEIALEHNASVVFFGSESCPPGLGVERVQKGYSCAADNAAVADYILAHNSIETVILAARYAIYSDGFLGDIGKSDKTKYSPFISDESRTVYDRARRRELLRSSLATTVSTLIGAGKNVVIVYPIPEIGYSVPSTLARLVLEGYDPGEFLLDFKDYEVRQKAIFDILDSLGTSKNILRIYPHKRLCDGSACLTYTNSEPLYYDSDHLSLAGAGYVAPMFVPIFAP